jgi:hypothetical protein
VTLPSGVIKGNLTGQPSLGNSNPYTLNMSGTIAGTAPAVGDFIFLVVTAAASTTGANTPAPPTGFVEIVPWQALGTSGTTVWSVYAKKRASGETNYDIPQINVGRSVTCNVHAFWIDGAGAADTDHWTIGTKGSRAGSGGTFSTIAPSMTTTVSDTMAWGIGVERTSAAEVESNLTVTGTGWTKRLAIIGSAAANATVTLASKGMATGAATTDVTFTSINTQSTNGAALQILIPPVAGTPTWPDSVAGKLYDGSNVRSGKWYVQGSGGIPVPLSWAGMVHPGSPTITAMLAKPFFYCAHRGGSRNWPEMSLQGYTQSAIRGYDSLEISLARSSDGVWFGLHDASLDRTSLGTGGGSGTTYVASAMTWSAIQALPQNRPASGNPVDGVSRPYAKLDDILDAYMQTHVLFIDPKAALGSRAELITILKNRPNWQDKIVAKYVPGNATNSWLTLARTNGFATNAMFYDGENFATYHTQADILGMEYGAASATWTAITALGKPVMGHVIPTTAAVATATAGGAKGFMVSGVVQVPRAPM